MKRLALLMAILLMCSTTVFAGSSGGARGMSRGFSSARSPAHTQARPAATSSNYSSRFGSFSSGAKPASNDRYAKSNSAVNRDLEKSSAQQRASNLYDARQQAKTISPQSVPPTAPFSTPAPQSTTAPVIVQHSNSNMNGILTGVLIGQVLSHPHPVYVNGAGTQAPLQTVNSDGEFKQSTISNDGLANTPTPASTTVLPVPSAQRDSSGMSWWGLMFWGAAIFAACWWAHRRYRRTVASSAAQAHYSLGKL